MEGFIIEKIDRLEKLKEIAKSKGGICLSDTYINNKTKLDFKCKQGHIWSTQPRLIFSGCWCPRCRDNNRKLTLEEMQELASKYGGKCLSDEYINANTKLKWQCKKNHTWYSLPLSVKKGHWCIKCANKEKYTLEEIHELGSKLGYKCLSDKYINANTKLEWECSNGHRFKCRSNDIRNGTGCPICSKKKKLTIEEMQILAKEHDGVCLSEAYENNSTKLLWKCKKGHTFEMRANNVKSGQWCPDCSYYKSEEICRSEFEKIFKYKFPKTRPDWLINPKTGYRLELDGYCKELKLAFEHNGPQHYKLQEKFCNTHNELEKIKYRDFIKHSICKEKGITLIVIPQLNTNILGKCITQNNLKDFILNELKNGGNYYND